ncbi:MAG: nucleotidyltransferase domain-containing protein [bacterium]|nr:nucleotidyltransferase domain-containing protein [bacterium]
MIDLDNESLSEVIRILRQYVAGREIRVFGSRVNGTASKFSDLDLAITGREPLDARTLSALKDAFSESDLPIFVDVLDWRSISGNFQKVINQQYEILEI